MTRRIRMSVALPAAEHNGVAHSPSHDLAAERNVLGSMLLHTDAVAEVMAIVRPTDFYLSRHQVIAAAIAKAHASTGQSDLITVAHALRQCGRLDDAGGHAELIDLLDGVVTAAGVAYHAEIVRDHAQRRHLIHVAGRALTDAADGATTEDLRALLAAAAKDSSSTRRQARVLLLPEVVSLREVEFVIDGMLPIGVGFLVGPSNVGKTAVAVDWAMRVYYGHNWHGRCVRAGSVLYVVGEGMTGFGARCEAWPIANGAREPGDRYVAVANGLPPLSSPTGRTELAGIVADLARQHGHPPTLVVIDTLSAHWAESEDRSEFAAPAMAALAQLAAEHSCCVLLLHHERKPTENARGGDLAALRGSGAWAAAADFVLAVSGKPDAIQLATIKQRDAERAAPIRLRLQRVELGVGQQNRPRASVVVLPAMDSPAPRLEDEGMHKRAAADAYRFAVLRTVADKGGKVASGRTIVDNTEGRNASLFAAIKEAVAAGELVPDGDGYRLTEAGAAAASRPGPPLRGEGTREPGSSGAARGSREPEGTSGNQSDCSEGGG
ncbi:MAG: AAA family ATPase [Planctomycetota bacterium]